jgi:hypothetical protein
MIVRKSILILARAVLIAITAASQAGATDLLGTVKDSTTALPLANVSVMIAGRTDSTVTDAQGKFQFMNLPQGSYTLMVGTANYSPRMIPGVSLGFVCGDANGDRKTNVGDAVYLIAYIFKGGPPPIIMKAANINGDASVNVGDAVYLINYIFRNGPAPHCQ